MDSVVVQGMVTYFVDMLARIGALSQEEGDEFFEELNNQLAANHDAHAGAEQVAEFLSGEE